MTEQPAETAPAPPAPETPKKRRRLAIALGALALLLIAGGFIPVCTRGPERAVPEILEADLGDTPAPLPPSPESGERPLRVASLNLAHGRADGFHQLFTSTSATRANLERAGALLAAEAPDVVAFQEADGPSVWSGRFDHVGHVVAASGMPRYIRAEHVGGLGLSYGTALATRGPMEEPLSIGFDPTWPTFNKGFVVAAMPWPGSGDDGSEPLVIDVASVHLDFASARARREQIEKMLATLAEREERPRILIGDFNAVWSAEDDVARALVEKHGFTTWEPENEKLVTFPSFGERLDWVFVSKGLRIVEHRVLDETVSDHRAIVAEITRDGG